jgi:PAS domain S-box-containing protein
VKTPLESPTDEVTRLRACLNDLISVMALPALWAGGDPQLIVTMVLDALLGMLGLAFVFARLNDPEGGPFIEILRIADWLGGTAQAKQVRDAIALLLGEPATWPPRAPVIIGDMSLSIALARLGFEGDIGIVVAGSQKSDFPAQTERLLLDVTANQAAIGLQQARLLTQQKRVAAESERDSRLIVDTIPGLVAIMTPAGEVDVVNHELVEYCGQPLEEMKRWGTNGTVHSDDLPRVIQVFTQAITSGDPYDFEARIRRFDGVYRWCQVRGLPLRTSGHITRWYVLLSDIDDRKRAEDALRESERESRLIVDSIPGLVATFTPAGEVEFVNRQVLDYYGRTLDDLRRWATTDATHPEDLPRAVEIFTSAIASGDPFAFEVRTRRFDGVYRWFQSRGFPLRDANGHIVRWYNLLIDIDERKRAEEALAASEQNLKLTIDTIPALAWSARPDGSAEFFNQHYLDFIGFSAEQASGWGWTAAVYPEDMDSLAATWQGIMASEAPGETEARLRRHDGDYRWFLFRTSPLRDETGTIVKWYGVNTDITDRKRAEEELRRSAMFLNQAQRLTLTGGVWWDVTTGALTWSEETFRLFDVPQTTQPTVELALNRVLPEDLARVREMVDRSARDGANVDLEHRLLMPDGSVKHVHVVLQNVGHESGNPKVVGAVTDITERKRAEAELRRAYDHLTEAQRLSQTGSFTADLERDEHYWSDEFYRICEFEPGSTVTIQRLGEIVHPEDAALYEGAIGRAMAGTEPDFYFRIVTSHGVVKHLRGFAHRIADRPVFVGAVQDVTSSKMAQEALNRAGAELAHVSRLTSLSALTASIAHEVNQPLSGIITNAGTCLRMLDASPPNIDGARETARRTIRDGNRASDVVTRLRALFSKKEFVLEPLDLNEATREVIALSSNDLQRIRIILQSELADDLPIVNGDRIQLQQVILNLLRNASDAMADVHDRPRHLMIRTEQEDGDRVRVVVRDAGVGLPPQSMGSLFDAFYTTKSGGMGIGLFVSRSIVERHQGRLWAEPNDGSPGATFSFSIPYGPDK